MKDYFLLPAFRLGACTVAPLGNLYPLCDRSRRQPFGRFSKKMSLCGSGERENRSWAEKMKAEARAKQKVAHILGNIVTNNFFENFLLNVFLSYKWLTYLEILKIYDFDHIS